MSYNEWCEVIKKSKQNLKEFEEQLMKDLNDYIIYLNVFDKQTLKKLHPIMLKWIKKILSQNIDGKYRFG